MNMIFIGKERKIMKTIIKNDFESFDLGDDQISKYYPNAISVQKIADITKIDVERTHLILRKFIACGFVKLSDPRAYFTVWEVRSTEKGYLEFYDGYKKYIKDLLVASAASAPFVSLLLYFFSQPIPNA